jgi:enoyl-CoA hydratase
MDYSRYPHIRADYRGRILTLTLNRPEVLNAINDDLHEELGSIFYDVAKDPDCDVVVLTGAGRAFCAGGDLQEMKRNLDAGRGDYMSHVTAKRIIFSMLDLEKPLLARVNGHCMGLGATLALFCDLIYMADHAKIGDPHVCAGVVAGDGGAVIWPQLIGYARAKEFLFTGDHIMAAEAARMGLINHAVPAEELDAAVYGMAERLANGARDAIRWTKVVTNIGLKQLAHAIMDPSVAYEWQTFRAPDHRTAVDAFVKGERPEFAKARAKQ